MNEGTHGLVWVGARGMNAWPACTCGFRSSYREQLEGGTNDDVMRHVTKLVGAV